MEYCWNSEGWGLKISPIVTLSTSQSCWSRISHIISHFEKYEQKRKNVCYMKNKITDRPKCPKRGKTLFRNRTPFFILIVYFLFLPQEILSGGWRLCFVGVMVTIINVSRSVNCVCDEGTSGLLHAGEHFPEPRQFFFFRSATTVFGMFTCSAYLGLLEGQILLSSLNSFFLNSKWRKLWLCFLLWSCHAEQFTSISFITAAL